MQIYTVVYTAILKIKQIYNKIYTGWYWNLFRVIWDTDRYWVYKAEIKLCRV